MAEFLAGMLRFWGAVDLPFMEFMGFVGAVALTLLLANLVLMLTRWFVNR